MRIPLTKYGWPQVVIFPAAVLAVMIVFPLATMAFLLPWVIISVEALLAIVLIWVLAFFRDPHRAVPTDSNLLLAPADGKITNIEIVDLNQPKELNAENAENAEKKLKLKNLGGLCELGGKKDENDFCELRVLRIGIFLSIFNVHINRAPCNVKVEKITYKQGKHKNAKNPQSGRVNESNDLALLRTDSPKERLIVRQISGAIARRIVCQISQGQKLTGGEKFGMIKFGSRTELYCELRVAGCELRVLVQIGDKVKAGLTPLIRYEIQKTEDRRQTSDF